MSEREGTLPPVLTPGEVAELTRLSEEYLSQLRSRGGGPVFMRPGGRTIRYKRADVIAWLDASRVVPQGS